MELPSKGRKWRTRSYSIPTQKKKTLRQLYAPFHTAENTYAAQLSYCTTCDRHTAKSYNKNPTWTKSLCITVRQTWNNGALGTGLKRQPNQKCNLAIDAAFSSWLFLLPFALATGLLNGTPALLVREELRSVASRLQIQRMVTCCMFFSGTQKSIGFFKGASFLTIGHLSLKRVSLGSTVLYFPMLILKTLFVVIAVAFPKKPTISLHLPSLLTVKQTV